MKGRKPTPTALKRLRSTDQPVRINENEVSGGHISKMPPAPSWFSKMAKLIYKTKGKELMAQNIVGMLDIDMFLLYCNEYAKYIETSEQLSKTSATDSLSKDDEKVYQRISRENQHAWERAKAIAIEFGFTPSARSRVNAIGKKENLSDFEKLMNG